MFTLSLRQANHIRRYSIHEMEGSGWEVRLEADRTVTRHARYHDWHRVERALALFRLEISRLTAQGWEAVQ